MSASSPRISRGFFEQILYRIRFAVSNSCWKYHKKICCTNHIQPTGNLDSKTSSDVIGLLKRTSAEFHQTIVMITHNDDIARLADRIIRIEDGKITGGMEL